MAPVTTLHGLDTDSETSNLSRGAGGAPKSRGLGSRLGSVLPESATTLGQPAARATAAAAAATAVPTPADIVDEVGVHA